MQKLSLLISLFAITLFLAGCAKKFPGDDEYSLKNPSNRIMASWEITHYTIDGANVLDSLAAFYGRCWGYIVFYEGKNLRMHGDDYVLTGGAWNYSKSNQVISIQMGTTTNFSPPLTQPTVGMQYALAESWQWNIYQLDKERFEFYTDFKGTEHRMKAVKINE